jgi:hypothetical protein
VHQQHSWSNVVQMVGSKVSMACWGCADVGCTGLPVYNLQVYVIRTPFVIDQSWSQLTHHKPEITQRTAIQHTCVLLAPLAPVSSTRAVRSRVSASTALRLAAAPAVVPGRTAATASSGTPLGPALISVV